MSCTIGRNAHHHRAHIARLAFIQGADLHGQVGDVGDLGHAWHALDAAVAVVGEAGGFGVGALGVFLHHPQVSPAVVEQDLGIVHHAAVHPSHGERDANQ